jgi:hypothetical protein
MEKAKQVKRFFFRLKKVKLAAITRRKEVISRSYIDYLLNTLSKPHPDFPFAVPGLAGLQTHEFRLLKSIAEEIAMLDAEQKTRALLLHRQALKQLFCKLLTQLLCKTKDTSSDSQ